VSMVAIFGHVDGHRHPLATGTSRALRSGDVGTIPSDAAG
jgi:hypothetical protein